MDPAEIADATAKLDPARTLVVVASKTFTTAETTANAEAALAWLRRTLGHDAPAMHAAAITGACDRAAAMGIDRERCFHVPEWVGGRTSLWSPMGLAAMLALGEGSFRELLEGGRIVDRHVRETDGARNVPLVLALLGVWYRDIWNLGSRAVVAYDARMEGFVSHLQQLDMESNGKRVDRDGLAAARGTAPVLWGGAGTTGQHAYFQLLHQGTDVVPVDFLVAANGHVPALDEQHRKLLANCLAQSQALMAGRSEGEAREALTARGTPDDEAERLAPHCAFPGNRPSTTVLYERLTPRVLGQLIALYEHRVFAESVLWNINAFDQPGVELGKQLAGDIDAQLAAADSGNGNTGKGNAGGERVHNDRPAAPDTLAASLVAQAARLRAGAR